MAGGDSNANLLYLYGTVGDVNHVRDRERKREREREREEGREGGEGRE